MLSKKYITPLRNTVVALQIKNQEAINQMHKSLAFVSKTSMHIQKQAKSVWNKLPDKKSATATDYDIADILYSAAVDIINTIRLKSEISSTMIQSSAEDLKMANDYLLKSKTLYVSKNKTEDKKQHKEVDDALSTLIHLNKRLSSTTAPATTASSSGSAAPKPSPTQAIRNKRKRGAATSEAVLKREAPTGSGTQATSSTSLITKRTDNSKRIKLSVEIPADKDVKTEKSALPYSSSSVISSPNLPEAKPSKAKPETQLVLIHTFADKRVFYRMDAKSFMLFNPKANEWSFPEDKELTALQAQQQIELAKRTN